MRHQYFLESQTAQTQAMIVLHNSTHGKIIRLCMGILQSVLGGRNTRKLVIKIVILLPQCINIVLIYIVVCFFFCLFEASFKELYRFLDFLLLSERQGLILQF